MLLYRVFRHLPGAKEHEPGHPLYLHRPQGQGRWDNDDLYGAWYLARNAECAVGETLGDHATWRPSSFDVRVPAGGRFALGVYQVRDTIALLDLNNSQNLWDRGLNPTQIAIRNRSATQDIARSIFCEKRSNGIRKWDGISWWSTRWPHWNPICLWVLNGESPELQLLHVDALRLDHPAVVDAAQTLAKPIA